MVDSARAAAADLFGAERPDEIVFGQNMTSLTLALGRALARTWRPGDEIVCTTLDHDANVSSWMQAAAEAGCHRPPRRLRPSRRPARPRGGSGRRSPTAPGWWRSPTPPTPSAPWSTSPPWSRPPTGGGPRLRGCGALRPPRAHRRRRHRLRLPRRVGVQVLRATHRGHVRAGRAAGRARRGQDQAGPERGPGQVGERHPELREPGRGSRRRRLPRLVGRGGGPALPDPLRHGPHRRATRRGCPAASSTGSPSSAVGDRARGAGRRGPYPDLRRRGERRAPPPGRRETRPGRGASCGTATTTPSR